MELFFVGVGGFGEIYLCGDDVSRPVRDDALKAVKIEPHSNGPLFVEMNFYIRAASPDSVSEFMQVHIMSQEVYFLPSEYWTVNNR